MRILTGEYKFRLYENIKKANMFSSYNIPAAKIFKNAADTLGNPIEDQLCK